MKVTNLRRKLAAALVAGGMLAPSAAVAADLNVNLIENAGFENLNVGDSQHILDWTDGSELGFTYASGVYDNGGPLAGGGERYFTANGGSDPSAPGLVSQSIDVSTGDSAALIATGDAVYNVSGFFTTYLNDGDFGTFHVDFLDSGAQSLGTASIGPDGNLQNWTLFSGAGLIPIGTETVLASVYGTPVNGGPDGYIDNVEFSVTDDLILPALDITVDRSDGSMVLANRTGSAVNLSGYQITSSAGALEPDQWVSIADNYDGDSGGDVDGTNAWSILSQTGANGDLSEGDLDSGLGGSLANSQSINLGNAGTWIQNVDEDLVFQYISDGVVETGIVSFAGDLLVLGDVNTDGDIDATDWGIVRSNQHTDLSGFTLAQAYRLGDLNSDLQNNHADFVLFKNAFDGANGAGALAALIASEGAVPEPSSVLIVMTAGLAIGGISRRWRR